MSTNVLREITPLGENDFMYVADRHKKEFDYPIHQHEIFELNFVMGGAGCRRVVGDSNEVIGDLDLVLITSPDLEHVWEQNGAQTEDIHEVTVQFNMDFDAPSSPFRTNPFRPIYLMLAKAKRGLSFPPEAIMMVSHRLLNLSKIKEGFLAVQEFLSILYELSKCEGARELASSAFAKVEVDSDSNPEGEELYRRPLSRRDHAGAVGCPRQHVALGLQPLFQVAHRQESLGIHHRRPSGACRP